MTLSILIASALGILPGFKCIDTTRVTAVYEVYENLYADSRELQYHPCILEVGDNCSTYYCINGWSNYLFEKCKWNKNLYDSYKVEIVKLAGTAFETGRENGLQSLDRPYEYVIKHYPNETKLTHTFSRWDLYKYEEELPQFDWQLEEGDTTLLGYTCHFASCQFRGRTWRAAYALDIPISEGPWKLCGLPGLILYAKDSKNDFTFVCDNLSSIARPMFIPDLRFSSMSPERKQYLDKLMRKDPYAYNRIVNPPRPIPEELRPYMKETPKPAIPSHEACLIEIIEEKKK